MEQKNDLFMTFENAPPLLPYNKIKRGLLLDWFSHTLLEYSFIFVNR